MSRRDLQSGGRRTSVGPSGPPAVAEGREIAFTVVERVIEDEAWASAVFDELIERRDLRGLDRRFATQLVMGSLRFAEGARQALQPFLKQPFMELDVAVRATLMVITYELHFMRSPAFAVVSDAVSWMRHRRGEGFAKLVNAVGRRMAERAEQVLSTAAEEGAPPLLEMTMPRRVAADLKQGFPPERVPSFLAHQVYGTDIRVRTDVEAFLESTHASEDSSSGTSQTAAFERYPLLPNAVRVRRGGDPRKWSGYGEGDFAVQELGSQCLSAIAVEVVGLTQSSTVHVADLCAGHGGKSFSLLDHAKSLNKQIEVTAVDKYPEKLERLKTEAERLSHRVKTLAVDLTRGTGGLGARFDVVLVDAPCSGLGTVHRRPEIMLRWTHETVSRLVELQRAITAKACTLVKPGGFLIYSVCSPLSQEIAPVVEDLVNAGFLPVTLGSQSLTEAIDPSLGGEEASAVPAIQTMVRRLGPWAVVPTDAYCFAVLQRPA